MDVKLIDARVCSQENGEKQIILTAEVHGYDIFVSLDEGTELYDHFVQMDIDWFKTRAEVLVLAYKEQVERLNTLMSDIDYLPGAFDCLAENVDEAKTEWVDNEIMLYALTTRKAATWFGV